MNTDSTPAQNRFRRKSRTYAPPSRAPSQTAEPQTHLAPDISPEGAPDDLLTRIRGEISDEYAKPHGKPWIVGYSGGKDSTLVAHLVIEHLISLPRSERTRDCPSGGKRYARREPAGHGTCSNRSLRNREGCARI